MEGYFNKKAYISPSCEIYALQCDMIDTSTNDNVEGIPDGWDLLGGGV